MKTILFADNQYLTSASIEALFLKTSSEGFEATPHVMLKSSLIKKLEKYPEAVVVIDLALFDNLSVNNLSIIQNRFPKSTWLHFSNEFSPSLLLNQWSLESTYFLFKQADELTCIETVEAILDDRAYEDSEVIIALEDARKRRDRGETIELTKAEKDILLHLARGLSTKEIAEIRFTSVMTVQTQKKNLFRKLDINSNYEAMRYAIRIGLIDMTEFYL